MVDERTQKYLEKVKKNMDYRGSNGGWYDIKEILEKAGIKTEVKEVITYNGYLNSSDIVVYSYEVNGEQRYCAELSYQTDIDNYCIETHIFDKCPSEEEVKLIRDIQFVELEFQIGRLKPEFTCWECGRTSHWLDIPGSLQEKIEHLKEGYCGC